MNLVIILLLLFITGTLVHIANCLDDLIDGQEIKNKEDKKDSDRE